MNPAWLELNLKIIVSLLCRALLGALLPIAACRVPSDAGWEPAPAAQGSAGPRIAERMTPRFVLTLGPAEQQGMGL